MPASPSRATEISRPSASSARTRTSACSGSSSTISTWAGAALVALASPGIGGSRQRDGEGRPLAERARDADLASVAAHDLAGDDEAQPGPSALGPGGAEVRREELLPLLRRHAPALVRDRH